MQYKEGDAIDFSWFPSRSTLLRHYIWGCNFCLPFTSKSSVYPHPI